MGGMLCKYHLNAIFCQFKEELQYDKTRVSGTGTEYCSSDGAHRFQPDGCRYAEGMHRGMVLAHKDVIQNLQESLYRSGKQCIYAPTFGGGNRVSLTMHGLQAIWRRSTALWFPIQEKSDAADHKVYVAAILPPSGKMMAPAGEMTYEAALKCIREQIGILKDSGVDLIVAETMINIEETPAGWMRLLTVCELPIMCTMTVDADGSIFSGGNVIEAAVSLEAAGRCCGWNCLLVPISWFLLSAILKKISIPVIAKPNAGMPFIDDMETPFIP